MTASNTKIGGLLFGALFGGIGLLIEYGYIFILSWNPQILNIPEHFYIGENSCLITNPLVPLLGCLHAVIIIGWTVFELMSGRDSASLKEKSDKRRWRLAAFTMSGFLWFLLILIIK